MAQEFIFAVAFVAVALAASGALAQRLHLPHATGYLLAGLLSAPAIVGSHLLPDTPMEVLGEVGILLLLFLIGLELDLTKLRESLAASAATLPFDLILPWSFGTLFGRFLGWTLIESVVLGLAIALSSTLIGERLAENLEGKARQGVLGTLVSQDVAAGALLAIVAILGGSAGDAGGLEILLQTGRLLLLLLVLTIVGLYVVPVLLDSVSRYHVHQLIVLWSLALLALFSAMGSFVGSMELGAFVAGVVTAESGSKYVTRRALESIRDVGVAVFLFTAGYQNNLIAVVLDPLPSIGLAVGFLVLKMTVHTIGASLRGIPIRQGWVAAASLSTLGEFSLVIGGAALASGVANPSMGQLLIGAILVLLPLNRLLMMAAPLAERGVGKIPRPIRGSLAWVRGIYSRKTTDQHRLRQPLRRLGTLVLLLVALIVVLIPIRTRLDAMLDLPGAFDVATVPTVLFVLLLPLLYRIVQAYRDVVWVMVAPPGEELSQASKTKTLFLNGGVVLAMILLIAPFVSFTRLASPLLAAIVAVAVFASVLLYRQFDKLHGSLEKNVARILGTSDEDSEKIDEVLGKYPWGVRSVALPITPGSPIVRKHLGDVRIPQLTGASVVLVRRGAREFPTPSLDFLLLAGDQIVLLGDEHQIGRAESLIVNHGSALQLAVQSKQMRLLEVTVDPSWSCVGHRLDEIRIKHNTGALVSGVWQDGASHPLAWNPSTKVYPEDRLILIGTDLQLERAKKHLREGNHVPGPVPSSAAQPAV